MYFYCSKNESQICGPTQAIKDRTWYILYMDNKDNIFSNYKVKHTHCGGGDKWEETINSPNPVVQKLNKMDHIVHVTLISFYN